MITLKDYIAKYTLEKALTVKMNERNITVDKINSYVCEEAKKMLNSQNGAIDDATINNWIVHYVEDAYKTETVEKKEDVKVEAVANVPEKKEEKHELEQLDLFESLNM